MEKVYKVLEKNRKQVTIADLLDGSEQNNYTPPHPIIVERLRNHFGNKLTTTGKVESQNLFLLEARWV